MKQNVTYYLFITKFVWSLAIETLGRLGMLSSLRSFPGFGGVPHSFMSFVLSHSITWCHNLFINCHNLRAWLGVTYIFFWWLATLRFPRLIPPPAHWERWGRWTRKPVNIQRWPPAQVRCNKWWLMHPDGLGCQWSSSMNRTSIADWWLVFWSLIIETVLKRIRATSSSGDGSPSQ